MQSLLSLEIQKFRDKATELFKLKDFLKALNTYEEALHALNQRSTILQHFKEQKKDSPSHQEIQLQEMEIAHLKSLMFNNMALCHMKLNEKREATYYLKRCLELDPDQPKAWFRKIQLKMETKPQKALRLAKECFNRFENDQKEFIQLIVQIEGIISKQGSGQKSREEYEQLRDQVCRGSCDKQIFEKFISALEIQIGMSSFGDLMKDISAIIKILTGSEKSEEHLERLVETLRQFPESSTLVLDQISLTLLTSTAMLQILKLSTFTTQKAITALNAFPTSTIIPTLQKLLDNSHRHSPSLEGGDDLTHSCYQSLLSNLFSHLSQLTELNDDVLRLHHLLQRIFLFYKDQGESEWIQRVVRFDIKSVDGIVKSWVGSAIFMDWSIEVAESTTVKGDKSSEEESQLKQYIEIEVFNNFWITGKGKAVLQKIKPALQPLTMWKSLSQCVDIQLQGLSLASKHLATINESTVKDQAEVIYNQTLTLSEEICGNAQSSSLVQSNRLDLLLDILVNLTLKDTFNKLLINNNKGLLRFIFHQSQLNYQQILHVLLNLLRDRDFELKLPSYSYKCKESVDMSYYQMKELKNVLKVNRQAQMNMADESINEYPEENEQLRRVVVCECEIVSVVKGMKGWLRKAQVATYYKMVSEVIGLIAADKGLIGLLVNGGMIGYILDIRKNLLELTSKDHSIAIQTEINLAQAIARIFINTNPHLIQDHSKFDAVTFLVKTLVNPSVHHELLIFEGLLALTNISSLDESFAEKMMTNRCWSNCRDLMSEKNEQIVIAAIELMANMALSESVTRFTKFTLEVEVMSALFKAQWQSNPKMSFAILTLLANTVTLDQVKGLMLEKPDFIGCIIASLTLNTQLDLAHRIMFILDELKDSLEVLTLPSTVTQASIQVALSKIISQCGGHQELRNLCEAFISQFF